MLFRSLSFVGIFGLLAFAVARYFPPLDPVRLAMIAVVFFCFGPVMRRCLMLGQTTPLVVLLFGVVYLLAREKRDRLAGLVSPGPNAQPLRKENEHETGQTAQLSGLGRKLLGLDRWG